MVALHPQPVEPSTDAPRFIYLCGADGTGKSTQTKLLLEYLAAQEHQTVHRWLRFPFFTSVPLLAYAKLRGWSWYETTDGVRHGYWDFRRSLILRTLLPWTMLLDASVAALTKIYVPLWQGKTVVCERFVLDMLVDLAVAFDDPALHRHLPGRWFRLLIPQQSRVVVLDLDAATIRARRADLQMDHRLEERLPMFRRLASDLSLVVVSSALPMAEVTQAIRDAIGQAEEAAIHD